MRATAAQLCAATPGRKPPANAWSAAQRLSPSVTESEKAERTKAQRRLLLQLTSAPGGQSRAAWPGVRRPWCAGGTPRRGLVSSVQFIPAAEASGLIVPLGDRCFGRALLLPLLLAAAAN